jgi:Undecaprenyl-phosphate galactose phosphotransferase WbaP
MLTQIERLAGGPLGGGWGGPAGDGAAVRRRSAERRWLQRSAPLAFLVSDMAALALAFAAAALSAAWINETLIGRDFLPMSAPRQFANRGLEYLAMCALLVALLGNRGLYRQRQPFWEELRAILVCGTVVALIDGFVQYAGKEQFSRLWLVQNWTLAVVLLAVGRAAMRRLLETLGLWQLATLVVGNGANAAEVMTALRSQHHLGYRVIGHVDLEAGQFLPAAGPGQARALEGGGRRRERALLAMVDALGVDSVILAFDVADVSRSQELFRELTRRHIAYSVAPPLRGMTVLGVEVQHFFGHDVVLLRTRNNLDRPFDRVLKRLFDLTVAGAGLVALGPLMLALGLAVRRDGGPALFGHQRVGMHGRPFRCLKFRTMAVDSDRILRDLLARDPAAAAEWARDFKLRADPRVTPIGRFLRKSSLDELPQLFNVLRGDMSLVGPRPIVEAEVARYGDDAGYYLEARPGITGLWQVSGRNDVSYDRRVAMDAWYVRNWSIWHDIAILCRTIPSVLGRQGVY